MKDRPFIIFDQILLRDERLVSTIVRSYCLLSLFPPCRTYYRTCPTDNQSSFHSGKLNVWWYYAPSWRIYCSRNRFFPLPLFSSENYNVYCLNQIDRTAPCYKSKRNIVDHHKALTSVISVFLIFFHKRTGYRTDVLEKDYYVVLMLHEFEKNRKHVFPPTLKAGRHCTRRWRLQTCFQRASTFPLTPVDAAGLKVPY